MVSMSTVARIVPRGMPRRVLRRQEDVVPEARLEVALELGQVEVGAERRPAAALQCRPAGVEQEQPEVEQARATRARPSTSTCRSSRCQPRGRTTSVRRLAGKLVALALRAGEVELPVDRVAAASAWPPRTLAQVGDSASSRSAMNTLAPELSALMSHLPLGGPGDLDAPVEQVRGRLRHAPVTGSDVRRLRQEVQRRPRGERRPTLRPPRQQRPPPLPERPLQVRQERQRRGREDRRQLRRHGAPDLDPIGQAGRRLLRRRGHRTAPRRTRCPGGPRRTRSRPGGDRARP